MNGLPSPVFVERDPEEITREMVAEYERLAGKPLEPAQFERIFIDIVAHREVLLREAMQETGEQNLLAFAAFPMLDYLGALYGVERLPARPATTTLAFTLAETRDSSVVVPKGTRVRSKDGNATFATDADLVVKPGSGSVEVGATAVSAGAHANGYRAGDVATLVDAVIGIAGGENVAVTFGGADREDDERLRERIRLAPEALTVAGSVGAYRFHVKSAHQDIIDAGITSPEPGRVRLSVLAKQGLPGAELLDQVRSHVSADDVRPLTDAVEVIAPNRVGYDLDATLTLREDADADAALKAAEEAANRWIADRRSRLGADLVPSQIVAALSVAGVYDVTVNTPTWRVLGQHEWADAASVSVKIGGSADG